MSIHDEVSFDKEGKAIPGGRLGEHFRRLFLPIAVLLVGLLGYGLGRLSGAGEHPPVKIEYDPNIISTLSAGTASTSAARPASAPTSPAAAAPAQGEVYASSKGTKYYYAGCKSSVSAANKVTFASAGMAEQAGYTLASGCKP
jgi:hypothetical protein